MQFSTTYVSHKSPSPVGVRGGAVIAAVALLLGVSSLPAFAQSANGVKPLFSTQTPSYGGKTQNSPHIEKVSYYVNAAGAIVPVAYDAVADTGENAPHRGALNTPAQPMPKPLITLEFDDVSVADLIKVIAKQGDVGIIIGANVTARLNTISLKNKTPEEAIKLVAQYSGLSWRKIDDDTYAIANRDTDLPDVNHTRTLDPVPTGALTVPVLPGRRYSNDDANDGMDNGATNRVANFNPPALTPRTNQPQQDPKQYSYIQLHNIAPHMMAYWLDPAHTPLPREYRESEIAEQSLHSRNKFPAQPGVDPHISIGMNGGSYNPTPEETSYWTPTGSYGRVNGDSGYGNYGNSGVDTRISPQFGNNNNRNNNNRNNNNRNNGVNGQNGQNGQGAGVFDLPAGIDSLVAVDPQNVLLVYGTDEGVQKLEQIIGFLDRPLRQVEIEAQFVTVSITDQKQFGLDFSSANGPFQLTHSSGLSGTGSSPGGLSVSLVRDNFQATINSLVKNNRGKTVASPRVLAINNIPASISSQLQTPILLTSSSSSIGGQVGQSQNIFFVTTSIELDVTPTINNDDTITVVMQPQFQSQSLPFGDTGTPQITTQSLQTIANIKDGDTIALGGLRTKDIENGGQSMPLLSKIPLLGKLFKTKLDSTSDSDLIIFLTARIVRRVETPVPGT